MSSTDPGWLPVCYFFSSQIYSSNIYKGVSIYNDFNNTEIVLQLEERLYEDYQSKRQLWKDHRSIELFLDWLFSKKRTEILPYLRLLEWEERNLYTFHKSKSSLKANKIWFNTKPMILTFNRLLKKKTQWATLILTNGKVYHSITTSNEKCSECILNRIYGGEIAKSMNFRWRKSSFSRDIPSCISWIPRRDPRRFWWNQFRWRKVLKCQTTDPWYSQGWKRGRRLENLSFYGKLSGISRNYASHQSLGLFKNKRPCKM